MKLFVDSNLQDISASKEQLNEAQENDARNYYLHGPFIETEIKNGNGRIYPLTNVQTEIERFIREDIAQNRAVGECDHPTKPEVNLEKIAIKIEDLQKENNQYLGKARVLSTPMGQLIKTFIDDDVQIGVSTRALGSLKESRNGVKEVQNDFKLIAIDAVHGPSAPNSFVQGIMESRNYYIENGIIRSEQQAEEIKESVDTAYRRNRSKKNREQAELEILTKFFNSFR